VGLNHSASFTSGSNEALLIKLVWDQQVLIGLENVVASVPLLCSQESKSIGLKVTDKQRASTTGRG
jgi:hypothetical protein